MNYKIKMKPGVFFKEKKSLFQKITETLKKIIKLK